MTVGGERGKSILQSLGSNPLVALQYSPRCPCCSEHFVPQVQPLSTKSSSFDVMLK